MIMIGVVVLLGVSNAVAEKNYQICLLKGGRLSKACLTETSPDINPVLTELKVIIGNAFLTGQEPVRVPTSVSWVGKSADADGVPYAAG